jgi:short-subunit dehydrogenase
MATRDTPSNGPPRTIVITGASSGIGEALALRYARDGARLALLGRNPERLEVVAAACRRTAADVTTATIDVRSREELRAWLATFDAAAPVDLLIANAGVLAGTSTDGAIESADDSHALFETNVLGVINTIYPLLDRMMSRGRGQIGIVASMAAFVPLPDSPSYCGSKAALLNYGVALRHLVRPRGVDVSVICPGYITTPMLQQETGWKPFEVSVERAAELIHRGLSRKRSVIAFPFPLALAARIGGLLPDWAQRIVLVAFRFNVRPRAVKNAPTP